MADEKKLYPNYDMGIWFRTCDQEVTEPLEGKLTGSIPSWIQGTLLRNGPGCKKIGDCEFQHVFDGMAMIQKFFVKDGKATYQCKFLHTDIYKKNTAAKRIVVTEFGTKAVPDPCRTIFDRMSSMFKFGLERTDNTVVSVYPFGDQIYAMTEVPVLYQVDPKSLDTIGQKRLSDSLIVFHTAHPHVMPNGDVYNVGLSTEKGYVVVKFTNNGKGDMFETAEIVGSTKPRWKLNPSYMHSFGITENYYVIIEQPMCVSVVNMMRRYIFPEPFCSVLVTYPEHETHVILIHRETGASTRYATETLFFMHMVNSFEEDGKVMVDVCSYKDAKVLDAMHLKAIKTMQSNPDYGKWVQSRPKRIVIPLDAPPMTKVEAKLLADVGVETPRINYELHNGRPYKYFYGIGSDVDTGHSGSIIKVDTESGDFKIWHEPHCYPSEPIFIRHPDAKEEDDGVLLSSLLWGTNANSVTLIVFNAKNLEEIARVDFATPSQTPKCFHGWYLPEPTST